MTTVRLCTQHGSFMADVRVPARVGAAAPRVVLWRGGAFVRFTAGHMLSEGNVYREDVALFAEEVVAIATPAPIMEEKSAASSVAASLVAVALLAGTVFYGWSLYRHEPAPLHQTVRLVKYQMQVSQ